MTIKVKEYDLHAIIKDLIDSALEIDRPNKEKICNFIVNLVNNGGNKRQAAFDADLGGSAIDSEGNPRPVDLRKNAAAVEANRLLNNANILTVYEKLRAHRYISNIFTKTMSVDHMINVLYQIGMTTYEKNPRQAIAALKEAAILAGYYKENAKNDETDMAQKIDELHKSISIKQEFINAQCDVVDDKGSKRYN